MGEDYIERVEARVSTKDVMIDYISFDAAGCETFYINKRAEDSASF